jgi:hypothetical protein
VSTHLQLNDDDDDDNNYYYLAVCTMFPHLPAQLFHLPPITSFSLGLTMMMMIIIIIIIMFSTMLR